MNRRALFQWVSGPRRPAWLVRFDDWVFPAAERAGILFSEGRSFKRAVVLAALLVLVIARGKLMLLKC